MTSQALVKLAEWKDIDEIGGATAEQIAVLRERVRVALGSLNMDDVKRQVEKQIDAIGDLSVDEVWEVTPQKVIEKAAKGDIKATARAAAKENAEVTFKESMKQLGHSDDLIEALWQQVSKGRKQS